MGYSAYLKEKVVAFVSRYGKDIAEAISSTGLYFEAVVGQKCLESSYGESQLAKKYNNLAGIKNFGNLPNAGVILLDTTERINGVVVGVKKQPFATYPDAKTCFREYVKILQSPSKKYTSLGVFDATSPEEQIKLMAKAGYTSLSPNQYLNAMQDIIDATRDTYKLGKIS